MTIEEMHHLFKAHINRFDANYFEDLTPDVIDAFLHKSVIWHLEDDRYRHLWDMLRKRVEATFTSPDSGLALPDLLRMQAVWRKVAGKMVKAAFEGEGTSWLSRHWARFQDGLVHVSDAGDWVFDYIRQPKPVFVGGYRTVSHFYGDGGYDENHPPVDLEIPDIEGFHHSVVDHAVNLYITSIKMHLS